jgi:hypothetical protein
MMASDIGNFGLSLVHKSGAAAVTPEVQGINGDHA